MKELLTSLASGDNFSKLLLVVVLLLSGTNFFRIGETREDVERQAAITRAQVRDVHQYQLYFLKLAKGMKGDQTKLLQHFGLGVSEIPEPPQPKPIPYDGQ